jgi:sterol desaturase/sphingolipid hydroxylase (fatty acid hydroxylase superfamily)
MESSAAVNNLALQPLWSYIQANCPWLVNNMISHNLTAMLAFQLTCAPFTIMDIMQPHWTKEISLRPDYQPSAKVIWKAFKSALIQNILGAFLPVVILTLLGARINVPEMAPTIFQLCKEIILMMVLYDLFEYSAHRLLHTKYFWKYHAVHHNHNQPFAHATFVQDPVELAIQTLAAIAPCIILFPHALCAQLFYMILGIQGALGHSGYEDYRSFLSFGLVCGSNFHDMHHNVPNCNYGAFFSIIDRICGTYRPSNKGPLAAIETKPIIPKRKRRSITHAPSDFRSTE